QHAPGHPRQSQQKKHRPAWRKKFPRRPLPRLMPPRPPPPPPKTPPPPPPHRPGNAQNLRSRRRKPRHLRLRQLPIHQARRHHHQIRRRLRRSASGARARRRRRRRQKRNRSLRSHHRPHDVPQSQGCHHRRQHPHRSRRSHQPP